MEPTSATSPRPVLMTRRERREAEERARASSGDTVVVGGISFYGPAPASPALGVPAVPTAGPGPRLMESQRPVPQLRPRMAPHPHSEPAPQAAPEFPQPAVQLPQPAAQLPQPEALRAPLPASEPAPVVAPAPEPGPEPAPVAEAHPEAPLTRAERAGREPAAAAPGRKRNPWLPRVAVLGTLAAATIAAPLAPTALHHGASPFGLDTSPNGPSTLDVVSHPVPVPPTSAGIAAAPVVQRADVVASRSEERNPLPGCNGDITVNAQNGRLSAADLCDLPWAPGMSLQPRAAVALTALNEAFTIEFGHDIALADSYRSIGRQYSVKESRGYLAAAPGTSMHGYGVAIDLASSVTGSGAEYKWLVANAAAYGWVNPPWAQRGGSSKYEPWHFEFKPIAETLYNMYS